jgi:hypothetical protein
MITMRNLNSLALFAALTLAISGCMGGNGNLSVKATDAPGNIDDFKSVMVTVPTIKVHQSGKGGDSDSDGNESGSGWKSFDVDASRQVFDLAKLLNGNTTQLLNASLPAGKYTQIRLMATKAEGTLKNGSMVSVAVPNNSLKIVKSFDIAEGKTTTFVVDINVVKDGKGYKLSPVIGKSIVSKPE